MPDEKFYQGEALVEIKATSRKFRPGDRVRRSDFSNDEARFDSLVSRGKIKVEVSQASAPASKAKKTR